MAIYVFISLEVLVALFTGAWIEIKCGKLALNVENVALFTGAWIEMVDLLWLYKNITVALFTGAWIEMAGYPCGL